MSNKYIFIANTLASISGAPIYIRNKTRYLRKNHWTVVAMDCTNVFNNDIVLEELKIFKENRFYELLFPPSWYSRTNRERVIKKLLSVINCEQNEECVIESLGLLLGQWGELLAKELKCKHIIFDIGENVVLKNRDIYSFAKQKYDRNELFGISPKTMSNLFKYFGVPSDVDKHYWKAGVINDVENIFVPQLDSLPKADFSIGYFGRRKMFVPYIFHQVSDFAYEHKELKINLIILGFDKELIPGFINRPNLNVFYLGRLSPIPKLFYDYTDVVIATAGCASISYKYAKAVITMSAEEDNRAIGILGKTTNNTSFPDKEEHEILPLLKYLNMCLSKEVFQLPDIGFAGYPTSGEIDYSHHLTYITPVYEALNVLNISSVANMFQVLKRFFVRHGLARCVYLLMNIKYRLTLSE